MKKIFVAALISVGMLMTASSAMAANSATGQANANVITALDIQKTADLQFGNGLEGDTLVITQAGAKSGTVVSDTVTPSAASFDVTGGTGQTYNAVIDNEVVMSPALANNAILDCGAANQTASTVGATTTTYNSSLPGGNDTINCGGSLDLTGAAPGPYSGSFQVTVNYP